ncbi:hypothetical protein E4U42_008066 [Claviceps africana]|uniref:Uncharacterized protein n=1 Tax=Claviceps africana TaxID=83212 RepID=A0A8K0J319_9HYPO|nr:hypothetical protein E4U42_008066 [Claviceps africana]
MTTQAGMPYPRGPSRLARLSGKKAHPVSEHQQRVPALSMGSTAGRISMRMARYHDDNNGVRERGAAGDQALVRQGEDASNFFPWLVPHGSWLPFHNVQARTKAPECEGAVSWMGSNEENLPPAGEASGALKS